MTYYVDHNSIDKAKGDLLLTAEASVEESTMPGKPFCITVTTPFHTLIVAAKDVDERAAWKAAIEESIMQAKNSIRGYITKKGGLVDRGKSRKFFILHDAAITWHQDHEHTSAIQGMMKLTPETTIAANDDKHSITLTDTSTNATLGLRFDSNNHEYNAWKQGIMSILNKFAAVEKATVERIENAYENATKRGKLRMRPPKGGDVWDEYYFVLTANEILVMEKNAEGQMEVIDLYEIHPNCSVFETNLGHYAFELVTSKKVLHVMSDSRESTSAWIHAIRSSIANSQPESDDPLLQAALSKLEEDVFYDVSFHEDKPLGVVLERSGEWALVKLSNFRETGVSIGSALTSINGESCILKSYAQTIEKLKNWKPPLHLGFRRAPRKSGYLVKLSRQRRGNSQKNWKERFFVLEEGRLVYKENESPDAPVKGDVPLMGSAVSLMSSAETGKFFCFRVVSGVTSLVMQGVTMDEMMDWASTLYHAIAIANGGAHILSIERKRVEEQEARERAREEAIAARAREEAEAKRQKEEAEAKARAEEEARRKAAEEEARRRAALAEEERLKLEAADRKQKAVDEACGLLTAAMSQDDSAALAAAIKRAEGMEEVESDLPVLVQAKEHLAAVQAREEAVRQARADAENTLIVASESATMDNCDTLASALHAGEEASVDQNLINNARAQLMALRKEKAMIEEIKGILNSAIAYEMAPSLEEAIETAQSIKYCGPEVEEARRLLERLKVEEARRVEEENARLAAEAAALDAEMAATAASTEEEEKLVQEIEGVNLAPDSDEEGADAGEDFDDDDIGAHEVETVGGSSRAESTTSTAGASMSTDVSGSTGRTLGSRRPSLKDMGRKLGTRAERLEKEAERSRVTAEGSITTDEQLERCFHSYARRVDDNEPSLNPMQFSTIFRLITGEKGNLFKEMQMFQKFDKDNNGCLYHNDFVKGWREVANSPGGGTIVDKIGRLIGEDNVML
eukprot:CAMPEP_0185017452 /NCGR_PEP_ID=MMETSP1103-20130426/406_1 /TAXON_ID=36769 /ORGANISM="Paraphysomonas bandaiensis, Strain Caron Lab Isolate" /LENGTH=972 /DNA_ID=CAMNT_0027546873 /DNA_START=174 /DNA_END=3092 /DNA_ORIENTATION=+